MTRSKANADCVLAGDIGGTKTNLGLFVPGRRRPVPEAVETFSSRDAGSLEAIIDRMADLHRLDIAAACFGIAGPVINGECRATNLPWVVSEKRLRRRFGWRRVKLMNDLSSTAAAVPLLESRELRALNRARVNRGRTIGLLAPGTGLGMALLVNADGRHLPVASEGGHANFGPSDEEQIALWRFLSARFGHVSKERLLSGRGLEDIYNWLKSRGELPESARIREAMRNSDGARVIAENAIDGGDPLCRSALQNFCRIFGSIAGDLALTGMATGGIFLGGGIPPKILPVLEKGDFAAAFVDKGRFQGFMEKIAVRVILNDRAALLGAAACALNMTGE